MAKNVLAVRLTLNASEFTANLNRMKRQLNNAFGKDAIRGAETIVSKLKYLGVGMAAVGVKSVKMAADFEMTKRSMSALAGDADIAGAHLRDLEKFAATTPFQFPELVEASKRMQAYGADVSSVLPMLETLGDAAMALGLKSEGLDRLTLAIGQVMAKGKLSAEEMRQLAETGLPAWQIMAEKIGISVSELMARSKKGAVSSSEALNALFAGMTQRYGGMMKAVAGEIPQQFSNMKDSISFIMREIGNEISEALDLKARFSSMTGWLNDFAEAARSSGIKEAINQMVPENVILAATTLSGVLITSLIPAIAKYALCVYGLAGQWGIMTVSIGAAIGVLRSNGAELTNYISGPVQSAIIAFGAYQSAIALATVKNLLFTSSVIGWLGNIKAWISLAPAAISSLSAFTGWLGLAGVALSPVGIIAMAVGAGYWLNLRDQMREAAEQAEITKRALDRVKETLSEARGINDLAESLDTARTKLADMEVQARKTSVAMLELSTSAFISRNSMLGGNTGGSIGAIKDSGLAELNKQIEEEKKYIKGLEEGYQKAEAAAKKAGIRQQPVIPSGGNADGKSGKSATESLVENIRDRMKYLGEDGNQFLGILDKWQAKLKPLSEDWKKIADLKFDILGENVQKSAEKAENIMAKIQKQKDDMQEMAEMYERADAEYFSSLDWENQQGLLGDNEYLEILQKQFDSLGSSLEALGLDMQNVANWSEPMREKFSKIQSVAGRLASDTMEILRGQFEAGTITNVQYLSALEAIKVQFEKYPAIAKMAEQAIQAFNAAAQSKLPTVASQVKAAWDDMQMSIAQVPDAMGNAFMEAIKGSKSLGDALNSLLADIGAVIAKALIMKYLVGPLMGFMGFADGGVFTAAGATAFAQGGIVNKPTLFPFASGIGLMGEAGPEAIMPLERGTDGKLGVKNNAGGGQPVIINVLDKGDLEQVTYEAMTKYPGSQIVTNHVLRQRIERGSLAFGGAAR